MSRSCEDHQARYLEGDPEALEHAAACPVCGRARAQLDAMRAALASRESWAEPRAGLEERVVAAAAGRPAAEPPSAPVVSLAERRRSRRQTLRAAVAACAAGIALTAGAGAVLDRVPGPDARLALAGTALAPGAGAEASLRDTESGVEIRLDVRGLPRAADGTYYQAWLKRDDGAQVPIGTFHTGAGEIVLWSGVGLNEYPALTVTVEREDGEQSSSGRVVLRATGE